MRDRNNEERFIRRELIRERECEEFLKNLIYGDNKYIRGATLESHPHPPKP